MIPDSIPVGAPEPDEDSDVITPPPELSQTELAVAAAECLVMMGITRQPVRPDEESEAELDSDSSVGPRPTQKENGGLFADGLQVDEDESLEPEYEDEPSLQDGEDDDSEVEEEEEGEYMFICSYTSNRLTVM